MQDTPVVRFDNVSFSYNGFPVLENVAFAIDQREFAAIIGPNGGGKTTLLRLVLGLISPDKGSVRVFGLQPEAARKRIGYMPQHPAVDLRFPVTVDDVVLLARLGRGKLGPFRRSDHEAAANAIAAVGLSALHGRRFCDLSSGQRQRVLIARALASDPELLLLDEPTANLDPSIQDELYELLHRLNQTLAVVVVSHDVGFVSRYVGKVVCVNRTVMLHPSSDAKGELVSMMYGKSGMRIVDHGHRTD
jgi:zinc transport system ATP-binding protein